MPESVKLADYIFTRLKQLGIGAVHGVPGDYNLNLLDFVEPNGLQWVGNANELNAGYAADGYARIKGFGALITTFGVGELSAINAIAGAYTERAAVVHIVGTPIRASQETRLNIHHTLGDGEYGHFAKMATHVTVAQTNLLDSRTAPEQIDATLRQCMIHSRPVYIQIPVDMVAVTVSAERLGSNITLTEAVQVPNYDQLLKEVLDRMCSAKNPAILVDGESRGLGLLDNVQQLINTTSWPTFTTGFGTGLIDMSLSNVHGIYQGGFANAETKSLMDHADLVLCFGPHFSTTNTYRLSAIPKSKATISFTHSGIQIGSEKTIRDIPATTFLSSLLKQLDTSNLPSPPTNLIPKPTTQSFSNLPPNDPISQSHLWSLLSPSLQPGDIILAETGTAAYGAREMSFPAHSRLFTSVTWLSIGYMLPAAQGAALAQRELLAVSKYHGLKTARTILIIGDGSFQMTAQELGTIVRLNLDVLVVLLNNDGYTIERCIHGVEKEYNDISRWRYLDAPSFFGRKEGGYTGRAGTYGELEKVLAEKEVREGKGLRMIELLVEKLDAPVGVLTDMMDKAKKDEGWKGEAR